VRRLLLLWVVVILYASLYPWQFQVRPVPFDPWVLLLKGVPHGVNRFVVRDVFVNLLLYVPVGLLTILNLGPRVRPWGDDLALARGGV
jgi:hypothetical protein